MSVVLARSVSVRSKGTPYLWETLSHLVSRAGLPPQARTSPSNAAGYGSTSRRSLVGDLIGKDAVAQGKQAECSWEGLCQDARAIAMPLPCL